MFLCSGLWLLYSRTKVNSRSYSTSYLFHDQCYFFFIFRYTDVIASYLHKQEPNMEKAISNGDQETFTGHKEGYLSFGIVMFAILTVGLVGNVLTLLVLQQRDHRRQTVSPLMMNLALADIFIIVFGYPIAIQANLQSQLLESSYCSWEGFVNGTVGLTSIFTLIEMGVVSYHGLKKVNRGQSRLSSRQIVCVIGASWLYGGLCMLPPLLGWNRFVLSTSKVSCCPDWAGKSASDVAYNLLLVILGFFVPLLAIIICYYKIYR